MINITGQHLINGQWLNNGQSTFASANPTTGQSNSWNFFEANISDTELAIKAANTAFKKYRRVSALDRANFLDAIAHEIEALGDQLVEAAMNETALPQARIQGERGRTCGQLRAFAANLRTPISPVFIDHAQPERQPLPKGDSRLTQIPLGPVVVFGASNFPLAFSTAGGDTASALAAGCPVIVKGHPAHPATTELVCHAITRAIESTKMPTGVFSMVQSSTPAISALLVEASDVKAVGFTGSQRVGDILNKLTQARPTPIPFFGELGSTNPQFILNEILANQPQDLANTQVGSMLMGHGQFCTSPGLVIVEEGKGFEQFIATLTTAGEAAVVGTMLTKGIAQAYLTQLDQLISNDQLTLLGQGNNGEGQCQTPAALLRVDAKSFLADNTLSHEIFGPCALIVCCKNQEEMSDVAQSLTGQLTASIHGSESDINSSDDLISDVMQHVGRLMFNQMPTGVEVCHSMQHGGPYPASTAPQTTSVGSLAMNRFTRPICLQNMPQSILPAELKDDADVLKIIV